tara:strand:+ start:70 stop:708 length:639 start_codon:yes stop_codon:yes gene_type:complete
MYTEIVLIIIITCLVVQILFKKDNRIEWESFNGKKYFIKNSNDKDINQKKADILGRLDDKSHKIVNYMHDNKVPSPNIANRTHRRFNSSSISEVPDGDKSAAYTVNKGNVYICLITNNKFNNENDSYFVILHELAHVMSKTYGHGEEFQRHFNFIVKLAVQLNLWTDPKYENRNIDYCGVTITTSPCSGGNCDDIELDEFYNEKLIEDKIDN